MIAPVGGGGPHPPRINILTGLHVPEEGLDASTFGTLRQVPKITYLSFTAPYYCLKQVVVDDIAMTIGDVISPTGRIICHSSDIRLPEIATKVFWERTHRPTPPLWEVYASEVLRICPTCPPSKRREFRADRGNFVESAVIRDPSDKPIHIFGAIKIIKFECESGVEEIPERLLPPITDFLSDHCTNVEQVEISANNQDRNKRRADDTYTEEVRLVFRRAKTSNEMFRHRFHSPPGLQCVTTLLTAGCNYLTVDDYGASLRVIENEPIIANPRSHHGEVFKRLFAQWTCDKKNSCCIPYIAELTLSGSVEEKLRSFSVFQEVICKGAMYGPSAEACRKALETWDPLISLEHGGHREVVRDTTTRNQVFYFTRTTLPCAMDKEKKTYINRYKRQRGTSYPRPQSQPLSISSSDTSSDTSVTELNSSAHNTVVDREDIGQVETLVLSDTESNH